MQEFIHWFLNINWGPILSGGAVGALITMTVNFFKDRVQPIENTITIDTAFDNTFIDAKLILTGDELKTELRNLFIVKISLTNKGNKDIDNLVFGIKLENNVKGVGVTLKPTNNLQIFKNTNDPLPTTQEPLSYLSFELGHFNRKSTVWIELRATTDSNRGGVFHNDLKLEARNSVKWISSKYSEEKFILNNKNIGPYYLTLKKKVK